MSTPQQTAADFIESLFSRRLSWGPQRSALALLATASGKGSAPTVALAEVARFQPGGTAAEIGVVLRGRLPRAPRSGEVVTISVNRYEKYHGYQIKSPPLRSGDAYAELIGSDNPGEVVVRGQRAYTTHHGPYTLNWFEKVPFEEVRQTLGLIGAKHGLVAVGADANVAPRWIYRYELNRGQLATYHADGAAMKTYRNLAVNSAVVEVVLDPEAVRGFALVGRCEEIAPASHPDAWREAKRGFEEINFGQPTRLFRHVCERVDPIALAGP